MSKQTGITTAVLAGKNSPDRQDDDGEHLNQPRYAVPPGAVVEQIAPPREQVNTSPEKTAGRSSTLAKPAGRGKRGGKK